MQLISAGYENTKYFRNRFELQECEDFTWKVPDWRHHLSEHLGRNATNYFMYQWAGPVRIRSVAVRVQQMASRSGLGQFPDLRALSRDLSRSVEYS